MAAKKTTTAVSRTETPTEIIKVGASGPNWMQTVDEDADSSFEGMEEYRVLARAKLIQGMTDRELKESAGGEGVVLSVPSKIRIADKETPFEVVPIFGFTEFCEWNDLKDTASNSIAERTFDKGSDSVGLTLLKKGT